MSPADLTDALAGIVRDLFEQVPESDRTPCEYLHMAYYPTSGLHTILFSALWTGDQPVFVQLRSAGMDLFERRLPKKRQFVVYTVLRRPPRNHAQEIVFIVPEADYVAVATLEAVDDSTGLLSVEAEIAAFADQLPLHGAN